MTPINQATKKGSVELVHHYARLILKWKWTAFLFFFLVVSSATLFCYLVTPSYTADGSIWIDEDQKILPFDQVQALGTNGSMQSHMYLLQSRALANEIIKKQKLYENADFLGQPFVGGSPAPAADPIIQENLIRMFTRSISVSPITGTRLVNVQFRHRNPKIAAEMLNALIAGYVDMIVRQRSLSSEQLNEVLRAPIESLRTEIAERERQLNEFGLKNDILPLTTTEAPTITKLTEFYTALNAATIDRITKFNYYNQVKAAPLGEIPDAPAESLVQKLRTQYMNLSREYAAKLVTLKPEYPEMKRLKSELDTATAELQTEMQNIVRNAFKDYQAVLLKEQSLQRELDAQKNEAYKTNSNSVYYNNLRIELESKKTLLESLTKKQSETDVSSGLKGVEAINVWVVNKAEPPANPTFPNKRKIILLALLVGLGGGLGLAFGIEYLNQTIKTSRDVLAATGLPMLGGIPSFEHKIKTKGPLAEMKRVMIILRGGPKRKEKERKESYQRQELNPGSLPKTTGGTGAPERDPQRYLIELVASRKPHSIQAESFRSIRTTLFVSAPAKKIKSILITSALAMEGKSSITANLGITLATAQLKVVIIDADLRKPKQHRIFSQDNGPGLSRFLSSDIDPADLAMPTHIPKLRLINSGPRPANPIDLLSLEKMADLVSFLRENYDYILFDTPPILAVSDAMAISSLTDAVILVCRSGQTPFQALKQAKMKLDANDIKCFGVIINGVNLVEQDGYYARQYYHYSQSG